MQSHTTQFRLLTMTAISVDRLLALSLRVRYKQIVTLNRARAIVLVFWIFCAVCSVMHAHDSRITTWYTHITIPVCFLTSILSYTTIFWKLHRHETQVRGNIIQERLKAFLLRLKQPLFGDNNLKQY